MSHDAQAARLPCQCSSFTLSLPAPVVPGKQKGQKFWAYWCDHGATIVLMDRNGESTKDVANDKPYRFRLSRVTAAKV